MSNYSKLTNFASKDSLASGNPLKVIKGTEIDDEFEAIETSIGTKADSASPTFTGTPAAPTAASNTNSTQIATTAFVQAAIGSSLSNLTLSDYTIEDDGSGNLLFKHSGTAVMKIDSSGNLTVTGNVTGFGTI
jgi:hypothetical protein